MKKILGFKEFTNEHAEWQSDKANRFSLPSQRNYSTFDPPYSLNSRIRGESKVIHTLKSLKSDPYLNHMVASPDFMEASPVIDYISDKITKN